MKIHSILALVIGVSSATLPAAELETYAQKVALSMLSDLVSMQINSACLKQVKAETVYIANKVECSAKLEELERTLKDKEGLNEQIQIVAAFRKQYQL